MATVSKTAIEARKLAKQTGKRIEKPIPKTPGLYVISQPTGSQSWAFRYRRPTDGKAAKLTLGPLTYGPDEDGDGNNETLLTEPSFGDPLDLDAAKELAQECRKMLRRKIDPATAIKDMSTKSDELLQAAATDGWTFEALLMRFIAWYSPNRFTTKKQTAYWLGLKPDDDGGWQPTGNGVLAKWKGRIFSRYDGAPVITAVDATNILDSMKTVSRNRARSALKLFGSWASRRGKDGKPYVTVDPFAGLRRERQDREKPRDRYLEDWEIAAIWKATVSEPDAYGLGSLLILTTAQRPEMTFEARWEQIDLKAKEWKIAAEDTKIDKPHTVPLSELALQVIGQLPQATSGYLFQTGNEKRPLNRHTWQKVKLQGRANRVAQEAGKPSLEHWTYKDLQRSAITHMERLGVWPHVTKAIQQHAVGSKSDQAYRGYDFDREKRKALEKWGKVLAKITA